MIVVVDVAVDTMAMTMVAGEVPAINVESAADNSPAAHPGRSRLRVPHNQNCHVQSQCKALMPFRHVSASWSITRHAFARAVVRRVARSCANLFVVEPLS